MKKISIILALTLIISLTGCGKDTTPTDIKKSSEITSSKNVSSDVVDNQSSSALSSSPLASSKATSSKNTSSKAPSSKAVMSKATPAKPPSSKQTSSRAASSKPASSVAQEPTDSNQFSASTIEQKLFVLVNEERGRLGLSKLSWSNTLYKSAKIRSDEIAAANVDLDISHTRPNGTPWSTTLEEVNYSKYYAYAGENLAAVQQRMNSGNTSSNDELAKIIFDGWKNSKGHYEAIIRPETKEIGIAVSRNSKRRLCNSTFWTN